MPWNRLIIDLNKIEKLIINNDQKGILEILQKLVSGYKPSTQILESFNKNDDSILLNNLEKKSNNEMIH